MPLSRSTSAQRSASSSPRRMPVLSARTNRASNRLPAAAASSARACSTVRATISTYALRTRRSLLPQILQRVKQEHPYEVPSVVAVPIIDGGPDYLGWILEQTEQPA